MIRPATHADLNHLVGMLMDFHAEARCYSQIQPCPKSLAASLTKLIDGEHATVAVVEKRGEIVGTTAAVCYPSWFNHQAKTGQEMFWYVKPEHRGKNIAASMFRWLEDWAKQKRLVSFTVASTGTLQVERLAEFYAKRGYAPWDVLYTKGFGSCPAQ